MITRIFTVFTLALLIGVGCAPKGNNSGSAANPMADSMKAAYTAFSAAWDAGKTDEFGKYLTTNAVDHNLMPGQEQGLAGVQKFAAMLHAAYPDMKSTVEDMRVDGNVLTARFKVSGTNSGPFMGMPPTNKKISDVMGIDQLMWQDGKFTEHWGLFDDHSMMQQLGLAPPMGAMPPPGAMPPGGDHMPNSKPNDKKM